MRSDRRIGIVGGGASTVCLLDALARSDVGGGAITVFDPSPHLWRGRPYQRDVTAVRVNIAPEGMTIRSGDKAHFTRWLAARYPKAQGENDYMDPLCGIKFIPRAMYGEYLEDSARDALVHLAESGWRVSVVRKQVVSADTSDDGVILTTDDGDVSVVDRVVLCTGRGAPPDDYGLKGTPGYVVDPYPLAKTLGQVDPDQDVAVLGSGLTGVDVVLALAAKGHRGRVHMLSRSGVLPTVRQTPLSHQLVHFRPDELRDAALRGETLGLDRLVEMMRAELISAGENPATVLAELDSLDREDPTTRLRRHLAAVDSPDRALRILQYAVPATGPDVWTLLSEEDKSGLIRRHYRAMMSICCPMTAAAAQKLVGLVDRGQLEIVPGVRQVAVAGEGFTFTVAERTTAVDVVINAVNPAVRSTSAMAKPLVDGLVGAGLAQAHPRGGVHVERATSRLTVDGVPDHRFHALGDLAGGSLFFTFGMPSLVDRARDIVDDLLLLEPANGLPAAGTTLQTA
ncbi:FAD/NAD(P)-binding protein [Saccharothrix sp. NRRL B-16314]|uniref:FAD/NAD(P)-binding protein n=1 Tax=Saccharothrix sp. NRRL B-16314 TaxID=1463825 RepID=UPI0009DDFFD6|nr:FAD/NAD(P)-binding protein [Saccharothrix sp. NRRL B-16314]